MGVKNTVQMGGSPAKTGKAKGRKGTMKKARGGRKSIEKEGQETGTKHRVYGT